MGYYSSFPKAIPPVQRQIVYALRTRAPLVSEKASYLLLPFDLHVLGLPLAFILSQDQTLHCIIFNIIQCKKFQKNFLELLNLLNSLW